MTFVLSRFYVWKNSSENAAIWNKTSVYMLESICIFNQRERQHTVACDWLDQCSDFTRIVNLSHIYIWIAETFEAVWVILNNLLDSQQLTASFGWKQKNNNKIPILNLFFIFSMWLKWKSLFYAFSWGMLLEEQNSICTSCECLRLNQAFGTLNYRNDAEVMAVYHCKNHIGMC